MWGYETKIHNFFNVRLILNTPFWLNVIRSSFKRFSKFVIKVLEKNCSSRDSVFAQIIRHQIKNTVEISHFKIL
jgi:hypothetical protein